MLTIKSLNIPKRVHLPNLTFHPGEVIHIVGPNGSGKSSSIAAMSGLFDYEGEIQLDGQELSRLSLSHLAQVRAYLPQQHHLTFNMNVRHYLNLSLSNSNHVKHKMIKDQQRKVDEIIDYICQRLMIADKQMKGMFELSGGEAQRVRVAASILQVWPSLNPHAKILLLDEPAAPLDVGQQSILYQFLDEIAQMGLIVVVANHDLNKTLRYAHKVLLLKEGQFYAFGKTQDIMTSERLSLVFETKIALTSYQNQPILVM